MYCQPLINFANRYINDIHIAENIVQDIFFKLWEKRSRLNPDSNIKSYIFTAVKNHALKYLRHYDVVKRSETELKSISLTVKTPEDFLHEKEFAQSVQNAINELPERCRLIFSMNRFDQLTYAEIASVLNISIKTVETQMGRALKFLRKHLTRPEISSRQPSL
jgi:RNA polymerase sigma-70 factor (ECF subfamily)